MTRPTIIEPWLQESHLLSEDFTIRDGYVLVPEGPGLGVEVDLGAVHHYASSQREWQS